MGSHLVFRLHGPLASWGGVAPGATRGTDSVPSRSALLGLISAALGIRRDQQGLLSELGRSVAFAVRIDREGEALSDYHTVSSASETALKETQKLGVAPRTRKEEIEAASRRSENVMLTTRWYRMDATYSVAVSLREGASASLPAIAKALREPQFVLSLGRKSCPLDWPLAPEVLETANVVEALRSYDALDLARIQAAGGLQEVAALAISPLSRLRGAPRERLLAWEDGVAVPADLGAVRESRRFDDPVNRQRWQFTQRREYRTAWPEVK